MIASTLARPTSKMAEEEDFRASLAPLTTPSLTRWLACIAFDWCWIMGAFLVLGQLISAPAVIAVPGAALCLLVIGARQHGLALMGHEGAHRVLSSHRPLNDALTKVFSFWFFGIAMRSYRRFHFAHHRLVGTDSDPELKHKLNTWTVLRQWLLPLKPVKEALLWVLDLFGAGVPHSAYAIGVLMAPRTVMDFLLPKLYQLAWVTLFYALGLWWVPCVWFLALSTTFWLAFRLRIWTEHIVELGSTDPTQRIGATWWQRFLFLPHYTWCHWEHHYTWDVLQLPVPCWNLPAARKILTGRAFPQVSSLHTLVKSFRSAPTSLGTMRR